MCFKLNNERTSNEMKKNLNGMHKHITFVYIQNENEHYVDCT